jgi:hypothetical protein
MPKTTKCELTPHFIYEYLSVLLNSYGGCIEDVELQEHITKACERAHDIINQGNLENIVFQCVLTVSEDF